MISGFPGGIMNIRDILLVILFCLVLLAWGCDPGSDSPDPQPRLNTVPQLTAVSPTESVSHMPAFTLTATGSDFISSSVIVFNGVEMDTEYVGATELRCVIQPDDTAAAPAGIQATSSPHTKVTHMDVWVRTSAPGGGDSGTLDFLVMDNHEFTTSAVTSVAPDDDHSPCLAITPDQTLHIIWLDYSYATASSRTAHIRSTDDGVTWSRTENFHFPSSYHGLGKNALAVNQESHLAAVWTTRTRAVCSMSKDGGDTWSAPVIAADTADFCWGVAYMSRAAVALDDEGVAYIAFNLDYSHYDGHNQDDQIWFVRSIDDGATWSLPVNISQTHQLVPSFIPGNNDVLISEEPFLAVGPTGNIHLAWHTKAFAYGSPNNWETYFSYIFHVFSSDTGLTWSAAINRSKSMDFAYYPEIRFGWNGQPSLSWHGQDSGIAFSDLRSFPCFLGRAAGIWREPVDLAPDMTNSFYVTHAVDPLGNINVAWQDDRTGNWEIYYARSIDGGLTWTEPLNISNALHSSCHPVLVCDDNCRVYLVWEDIRDGDYKIYFARSGQ